LNKFRCIFGIADRGRRPDINETAWIDTGEELDLESADTDGAGAVT
jgi:hypothetical protein